MRQADCMRRNCSNNRYMNIINEVLHWVNRLNWVFRFRHANPEGRGGPHLSWPNFGVCDRLRRQFGLAVIGVQRSLWSYNVDIWLQYTSAEIDSVTPLYPGMSLLRWMGVSPPSITTTASQPSSSAAAAGTNGNANPNAPRSSTGQTQNVASSADAKRLGLENVSFHFLLFNPIRWSRPY